MRRPNVKSPVVVRNRYSPPVPPLTVQFPSVTNPAAEPLRRSLIFHCFPKRDADWRGISLSTFRYRDVFNGRIIVSITYGDGCEVGGVVTEWFQQFGADIEFQYALNIPSMGINTTFRDQLLAIRGETGIVFKAHTKGISHPEKNCEATWRESMAVGCLSRPDVVEQKFREGYRSFSVFKSNTEDGARVMGQRWNSAMPHHPWLGKYREENHHAITPPWNGWHFPGAFLWFDPRFIPATFFDMPLDHYENEAFSCHLGPNETGFSLTPDNIDFRRPLCFESERTVAVAVERI